MLTTRRLRESLKAYTLDELLDGLAHTVKKRPADRETRRALATLYCIDGQWNKALLQAEILHAINDEKVKEGELLKNLILSEIIREKVLNGERTASLLDGEHSSWIDLLQQANQAEFAGEASQADHLRSLAFDQARATPGHSEQTGEFNWIADGDGRLGPLCEFICAGGYRWIPFESIRSIKTMPPLTLSDLLWLPATLEINERVWHGYLPARYPLKVNTPTSCKLGDETRWEPVSENVSHGVGRKMWITDSQDVSVMEMREAKFAIQEG